MYFWNIKNKNKIHDKNDYHIRKYKMSGFFNTIKKLYLFYKYQTNSLSIVKFATTFVQEH